MTPEEAAHASAAAVGQLCSFFMMDGATYKVGGELGFDGVDFYLAGRGGVLGDAPADVVAAAFVFFNPTLIEAGWQRTRAVVPRHDASGRFAGCAHAWAADHLADGVDYGRLAQLAGRIEAEASPACAPLFAGWRDLPEPEGDKALAVHRMNAMRELRGAFHGAAILAAGLEPVEALSVRAPQMAPVFGWTGPLPDAEACRSRWDEAELTTDRMFGKALAPLSAEERAEFAGLAQAALDAVV